MGRLWVTHVSFGETWNGSFLAFYRRQFPLSANLKIDARAMTSSTKRVLDMERQ